MDIFHADYSHFKKWRRSNVAVFMTMTAFLLIFTFSFIYLYLFSIPLGIFLCFPLIYHFHFSSIFPRNFLCTATDAVQVYASRHTFIGDLTRFISSFSILLLFTFLQPMAIEHKTREPTLIW
jgi:predicted membrane protein